MNIFRKPSSLGSNNAASSGASPAPAPGGGPTTRSALPRSLSAPVFPAKSGAAQSGESSASAAPRSPSKLLTPLTLNTVFSHPIFSSFDLDSGTKARLKKQFQSFFTHADASAHTEIGTALSGLLQDSDAFSAWAHLASKELSKSYAGAAVLLQDPRRAHTEQLLAHVKDLHPIDDSAGAPSSRKSPPQDTNIIEYNHYVHTLKFVRALGLPAHALKDEEQQDQTPKVMAMLAHYCPLDRGMSLFQEKIGALMKNPKAVQALAGLYSSTVAVRQAASTQLAKCRETADLFFSMIPHPELSIDNLQLQLDVHQKIMNLVLKAEVLKAPTGVNADMHARVIEEIKRIKVKMQIGFGPSSLTEPEKPPAIGKFTGAVTMGELFGMNPRYVESVLGADHAKSPSEHCQYPKENQPQTAGDLYQMVAEKLA
jgi:hypothetical protein